MMARADPAGRRPGAPSVSTSKEAYVCAGREHEGPQLMRMSLERSKGTVFG